jgi:ERCC4-type nuclease
MLIKIDFRESDLHAECIQVITMGKYTTPIKIVSENIPLGDIIICSDDGKEQVIIERKTLNDLAASIRDGRYKEQSFRLNQCNIHNHNIYYLIEGDLKYYKNSRIDKRSIISSFVSISHLKGFSLHKTNDIRESAEWIIQFAEKIGKDDTIPAFYSNQKQHDVKVKVDIDTNVEIGDTSVCEDTQQMQSTISTANANSYSQVIKRVKKENITPENIGEIMLSQIPNVSVSAAISIMKKFGTLQSLFSTLEKDKKCMDDIKTDKDRKINKTAISSIIKYLHYNIDE